MATTYIFPGKFSGGKVTTTYNILYIPKISSLKFAVTIDKEKELEVIHSIDSVKRESKIVATRTPNSSTYTIKNLPENQAKLLRAHINRPEFVRDIREKYRTLPLVATQLETESISSKIVDQYKIRNNKTSPITTLFPPIAQARPADTPNPNPATAGTTNPASEAPNPPPGTNIPADPATAQNDEGPKASPADINALANVKIPDVAGYSPTKFKDKYGAVIEYPSNINITGQDYIQFDVIEYNNRTLSEKTKFTFNPRYDNRRTQNALISIVLPIQPNASDVNMVAWNQDAISAVELGLTGISGSVVSGTAPTDIVNGMMSKIESLGAEFPEAAKNALRMFFARKAANPSGDADKFMSRIMGSIINPNMELLFNSPQLRPFNFNFQLTPRSEVEAKKVKNIIRVFKEASAVRRGIGDLFLKAPFVFQIKYRTKNKDHPSMNKFKICALQNVSVDYTPVNTYSTYEDGTMTAYNLTLQFMEIEPIFADDYLAETDSSVVGY